jgi:tetratricopeptide (TPR) repeat protein
LREEDDDSCDEIVLFDEDDDGINIVEECGDYSYHEDGFLSHSTPSEGERVVTAVHSRKDPVTGNFYRDRKSVKECIDSGFEEVQPGVYSGMWYFTYLFGEKEGNRVWADSVYSRRILDRGGKALKISDEVFATVQCERERGNRSFQRGQCNSALRCYLKAERLVGVPGIYLVPEQRDQLVKILSNQAECYLRMMKYDEAKDAASAALVLDKKHLKSILRRAKAVYHGAQRRKLFNSEVAAAAVGDLQVIIEDNGGGAQEAQTLMDLIAVNLNKAMQSQQ